MQKSQLEINKIMEDKQKQIIEEVSQIAKEFARKELALLDFEMFYEVMVPKASKQKAEKSLKKLRKEKWEKALKEANGNEEKALFIYDAS